MKKVILLCLAVCTFMDCLAYSNNRKKVTTLISQESDAITATITKNTSDHQFQELISYFADNGITLNLNKVDYNEQEEIISIKISLEKDGQISNYGLSSNQPISDIELGFKDQHLFISASGNSEITSNSLNDLMEQFSGGKSIDSLLSENSFDLNFSSNDIQDFLNNSSFDLEALTNQFFSQINGVNPASISAKANTGIPTYNFINKPGVNKLIIINGEESDFETLNEYAQNDQLEDVDNLKGTTAVSIYGEKAKDGAIIATTKK